MVDSHAHLNHPAIRGDLEAVLERATERGVQAIINVGYDLSSSEVAVEQAVRFKGFVWASVGIHPHNATSLTKEALARLKELALNDVVVAVGETGLDFYRNLSPKHEQFKAFEAQLELACEVKKTSDNTYAQLCIRSAQCSEQLQRFAQRACCSLLQR